MQVRDLKKLLESIPDDVNVVIREFGALDEDKHFKLDKPIGLAYFDKETNEVSLTDVDMFEMYKHTGWFPVNEDYVKKYGEISEDGEGGAPAPEGSGTLDSVNGMGAPVLASRGVTGSGDVPSVAPTKKKKRILSFTNFFSKDK